jgi:thioredoxin reductase
MMHGRVRAGRKNDWHRLVWRLGGAIMETSFGTGLVRSLMRLPVPFGTRVIVVGKGLAGIELAHFLVKKGKKVTIVDTREEVPYDEPPMPMLRRHLEDKLVKGGTTILTAGSYEEVNSKGLVIADGQGQKKTLEGDTIIFTGFYRANNELAKALADRIEVHLVGDCAETCGILEAIHSGFRVGCAI